jgi:sulfur relay (sulfurtransferase) complex TusBCD TusD component (DsrE family)
MQFWKRRERRVVHICFSCSNRRGGMHILEEKKKKSSANVL